MGVAAGGMVLPGAGLVYVGEEAPRRAKSA
jgi:hypothetical protein